ncbi:hypothetical protein ABPG74_019946 [Tetrahymena malaccensis]
MAQIIDNLLNQFQEQLLQDNIEVINNSLDLIEKQIEPLEDDETTLVLYGYYKYILAEICLKSGKFPKKNKKYEGHLEKYLKEYEEHIQNIKDSDDEDSYLIDQNENQDILEPKKYFLVLGETGAGKSSFIKNITQIEEIQASDGKDSHTQECQIYQKFIDTPGINATNMSEQEILLIIVKFLFEKEIKLSDIFIILIQSNKLQQNKIIREFSYVYFLYELFGKTISQYEIKFFIQEYHESSYMLNWFDLGLFNREDEFSQKRKVIFQNKDKAADYFEQLMSYYIRVLTFFDYTEVENLKTFKRSNIEKLREQIWSNKYQEELLFAYKKHIKNQRKSLFSKIKKIIELEAYNQSFVENQDFQYVLLIGPSQVGKSSVIEQLTNQQYLRGSGESSCTKICTIYRVDHDSTTYKFIDTPGFLGSEDNQTVFHSFKIIGDFMRRKQITEFKLLMMKDYEKQIRDTTQSVLNEFFVFVTQVFDQDVSFIDRQYLKNLLQGQDALYEQEYMINKNFLQDKVLEIFRSSSNRQDVDRGQFLKYVFFKSNFITDSGQIVKVPQQEDRNQQDNLFLKLKDIDYVNVETKVMLKIKESQAQEIIYTFNEFRNKFQKVAQIYNDIDELEKTVGNGSFYIQQDLLEFNRGLKLGKIKELKKCQYSVIGCIYKQVSEIIQTSNYSNEIVNDILKHFLPIQFTPTLFEITDSQPKSVLISRKQHYYSLFAHQLSKFIDLDKNIEHRNKLEKLAKIKLDQEICFHQTEHQKLIEQNHENSAKENVKKINNLSKTINKLFGFGISAYQHTTCISVFLKSFNLLPFFSTFNWADLVLVPLRIGIDLYQNYKGYISKKQFALNTSINVSSSTVAVSVLFISTSAVAWVAIASAGLLVLLGYAFSNIMFTSKQTYDQTIARALHYIMEDNHANQQLRYFEIAKLFKDKFNFTNYSQVNQKVGYEMFRKLEENRFDQQKQQLLLKQLFKPRQNQSLRDLIANYIVKNYILKQIFHQNEFDQKKDEDNEVYLNRIYKQIKENFKVIKTYYYKSSYIEQFKYDSDQFKKLIKEKLKNEEILTKTKVFIYRGLEFADNEQQLIENYKKSLNKFYETLQNNQTTYQNQIELSVGPLRLDDRFQILFNSYCNLTQLKIEQKLKQPTISQITKDQKQMKFILNNSDNQNQQEQLDNKELIEQLNLLCMVDKYIVNRYLQKLKQADKPNLTCVAGDEVIEADLEYSFDLHQIIETQKFESSNKFIKYIKQKLIEEYKKNKKPNQEEEKQSYENKINQLLGEGNEMTKRLQYFYQSVEYLQKIFK